MEVKLGYMQRRREGSRIKAVQMDNFGAMIEVKRNDGMKNERIRELIDVHKVDEVINENTMRSHGHM